MAGADPERLRTTPEDIKVYTLLGSTVFISSGMAVVGMFVTLYFAFAYGTEASFFKLVLIGLLALGDVAETYEQNKMKDNYIYHI